MKKIKSLILTLGLIGGLTLFFFVFAQEDKRGISISPLNFELTAEPGDTLANIVKISNPTNSLISVKMEVEDFKPVGELGQVIVEQEDNLTYSLKRWVKVEPSEFTLQPKGYEFVEFVIQVPESAEPGGKYGSILASISGSVGSDSIGAAVAQKVGALLLLTVSGPVVENLHIQNFSAPKFKEKGPIPFTIKFENKGTVHLRPKGFVTITNWAGKKVSDLEFPQLNVIPGSVRKTEIALDKEWLFGKYTAILVGSYGNDNLNLDPKILSFWVFPWDIFLVIFLVLISIIFYFAKTKDRWKLALRILFKGGQT